MHELDRKEEEFDIRKLFVPLTNTKAIHWIIIIGVLVYSNMLFNGFVWDDLTYVAFNPGLHTFHIIDIFGPNTFNKLGQYRALTALYFALVTQFFQTPFYFHMVQLGVHIVNTIMVYLLFTRFFKKNVSFFLSVVFLVHPVQVESVSFIASADNTLFFFFGMLALTLSFKKQIRLLTSVLIFCLLELSLLAKETGIGFIILFLLSAFIFSKKRIGQYVIIGTAAIVVYLCIRIGIGGIYFNNSLLQWAIPIVKLPLSERLLNLPAIMYYYVKIFIFPQNPAIDQLWVIPSITFQYFYFPLLVVLVFLLLIVMVGFRVYKKNNSVGKQYIFFVCWLVCGLSFYSQIIPLDATVADRWMYFPIVGFLGITGFIISEWSSKFNKKYIFCLAVLILLVLSVRTIIRNTNWSDNLTLFSHDARVLDNFDLESNIGAILATEGFPAQALPHTLKSVSLYPYDTNLSNLGDIYVQLGENSIAKKYYAKALATPNISVDHQNTAIHAYLRLAGLYLFYGNPQKAKTILTQAIRNYPNQWSLWSFLAISNYYDHDNKNALLAAATAKKLYPSPSTLTLYQLISTNKKVTLQEL